MAKPQPAPGAKDFPVSARQKCALMLSTNLELCAQHWAIPTTSM
jgi:hypothetical protein